MKNPKISTLNKVVYIWRRHDMEKRKTLSQKTDRDCFIGQINCMKEFLKIMNKGDAEELLEHMKYNCGYLLNMYLSIKDKKDKREAFRVFSEYINSLEWEEGDKIFEEIFYKDHTKFSLRNVSNNE